MRLLRVNITLMVLEDHAKKAVKLLLVLKNAKTRTIYRMKKIYIMVSNLKLMLDSLTKLKCK